MEIGWDYPKDGFVKVNVHALSFTHHLPNGNKSGVGIVVRDDQGQIMVMVSGSIRGVTHRANELLAFLAGLRCAFYENENHVQLETDNSDAVKEWEEWRWWLDPNHAKVIQQLEQRKKDPKLTLEIKTVTESQNRLARYLAKEGGKKRSRIVIFRRYFGQVRELWRLDMGLGPLNPQFEEITETEYENQELEGFDDVMGENGDWLVDVAV